MLDELELIKFWDWLSLNWSSTDSYYTEDAFSLLFLMDVALIRRGPQVVPNFLRVFQPLNTFSSCYVSSGGFQLISSLICQSQQEALSSTSLSLWRAVVLSWPFTPALANRFHTNWAGNPWHPTTVNSHVVPSSSEQPWKICWHLAFFHLSTPSQHCSHRTVIPPGWFSFPQEATGWCLITPEPIFSTYYGLDTFHEHKLLQRCLQQKLADRVLPHSSPTTSASWLDVGGCYKELSHRRNFFRNQNLFPVPGTFVISYRRNLVRL